MIRTVAKIAVAAVGLTLISMLFVGSFVGALHDPVPHRLPVGVVAPPAAARELNAAFARHAPGAFAVTAYPTVTAARHAILDRDTDGVLLPGHGQQRLLIAGAAGRFVSQAVTTAFTGVAAAGGQHLTVTDIRPMPSADQDGVAPLYFFIGLSLPSAAFGIALANILGKGSSGATAGQPGSVRLGSVRMGAIRLGAGRLAGLAGYAILAAATATWITDGIIGALPGAPAALFGVGVLTAFAISTAFSAGWRLVGPPLTGLLALLIVPVGVAAAGGAFGPAFVTSWYAHLGTALPAGAALPAVRDVVSFDGNALAGPLLTLCLWAVISAVVLFLPVPRLPWRRPAVTPEQTERHLGYAAQRN
jgi:hypothetical protein